MLSVDCPRDLSSARQASVLHDAVIPGPAQREAAFLRLIGIREGAEAHEIGNSLAIGSDPALDLQHARIELRTVLGDQAHDERVGLVLRLHARHLYADATRRGRLRDGCDSWLRSSCGCRLRS